MISLQLGQGFDDDDEEDDDIPLYMTWNPLKLTILLKGRENGWRLKRYTSNWWKWS